MKIYIITCEDFEYGYNIFVDVVKNLEDVLDICKKDWKRGRPKAKPEFKFNDDNTQVLIKKYGKFYTEYYVEEREL